MNNRGLTLVELIVAMVIGGIIVFALTCQFVAELTFRAMINDQIAATDEASIAMHHITRVLRYARPLTVVVRSTPVTLGLTTYTTSITATIDSTVAGISLPEFTADTSVTYGRTGNNSFEYIRGASAAIVISNRIKAFPVVAAWWVSPNLTIQLTAEQGNKNSSLDTRIRVLGGL